MPQTVSSQQPGASTMEENAVSPSYQFRSEIVAVLKELIVEEMASLYTILDQHPNVTWVIVLVKDFHVQMVCLRRTVIHRATVSPTILYHIPITDIFLSQNV